MDDFSELSIPRVHGAWWDKPLKTCKAARRAARRILKLKDKETVKSEGTAHDPR